MTELGETDLEDIRRLVRARLRFGVADGKPGIPIVLSLGDLDGPSGFSIRVTELQHTFLATFEPNSLARHLVNVLVHEMNASPEQLTAFNSHVGEAGMQAVIRINGKTFGEPASSNNEVIGSVQTWRTDLNVEIRGRIPEGPEVREIPVSRIGQEAALMMAEFIVGLLKPSLETDPDVAPEPLQEGLWQVVKVNRYERDPRIRKECIDHFGPVCQVCGFDFSSRYGELGRGFIEVHHIVPLSSGSGEASDIDPTIDVVPICSNCHSMIHRGGQTRSLDDVRMMLK
jgi:5-methylcytosine-specific restriction protein A